MSETSFHPLVDQLVSELSISGPRALGKASRTRFCQRAGLLTRAEMVGVCRQLVEVAAYVSDQGDLKSAHQLGLWAHEIASRHQLLTDRVGAALEAVSSPATSSHVSVA